MKKNELEFGGSLGTLALLFILPFTTFYLNVSCNKDYCSIFSLPNLPGLNELFNFTSFLVFVGWFVIQFFFHILPWGEKHHGLKLRSGKSLSYKCNGFLCFVLSICIFFLGVYLGLPVSFVNSHFVPLLTSSIIFSCVLSLVLYIKSFTIPDDQLAEGANIGSIIYDLFLGRELNPRFGEFDLKFFCELRPGLIGWVLLDLCFIIEAYNKYGGPTASLSLVTFFHIFYVADALWHEEAILTTMDITHDGLGFMLIFGNLSWVPFLYSLQARFLYDHPDIEWSSYMLGFFFLLNVVGYAIFRLSNSQKNKFRKNPDSQQFTNLKKLTTSSGKKLLVSSWWGISRHPNYMGDLIMSFTWSFVTGFSHIIPYFYPLYFLSLLIHRGSRDDKHCREKYGSDWDKYCKLVPHRIFPYIY